VRLGDLWAGLCADRVVISGAPPTVLRATVVNRWPAGVHGVGGSAGGAPAAFGCGAAVTLASTANPTAAPLAQAIAIMMDPCQAQLRVILPGRATSRRSQQDPTRLAPGERRRRGELRATW
jgi:hypothetical protein